MKKIMLDSKECKLYPLGIFILCDNCPCHGSAGGEEYCGLEFDIFPSRYIESISDIISVSKNCELVHIRYQKTDNPSHSLFVPEQIELVKEK